MAARTILRTLALVAMLLSLRGCDEPPDEPLVETVIINGHEFQLELAVDEPTRVKGLMDRPSIAEDGGMLFVFPHRRMLSFWMKDCRVDMDVIFLDPQGRVTATHRMKAQPPQGEGESDWEYELRLREAEYWSNYPAQFAIELKAGWLDRLDVKFQDKIELDVTRLKALAR